MSREHVTVLNDPAIFSRSFQQRRHDGPVKDPCDYVMRFGGENFKAVLAQAKHVVDYKFDQLVAQVLQADPNAHAAAIERAISWFAQYIHARTGLEPDHPALMTDCKRGAIMCRLSRLSGLTIEEVRRIIDYRIKQLPERPGEHLRLADLPVLDDPKRDAVLDQLETLGPGGTNIPPARPAELPAAAQ